MTRSLSSAGRPDPEPGAVWVCARCGLTGQAGSAAEAEYLAMVHDDTLHRGTASAARTVLERDGFGNG